MYTGPNIITDGLVLYLDAANTKSYPGTGTAWKDLSGNSRNGTLTNGPTFSSVDRGSIVLDGTNDYVNFGSVTIGTATTMLFWISGSFQNMYITMHSRRLPDNSNVETGVGSSIPIPKNGWIQVGYQGDTSGTNKFIINGKVYPADTGASYTYNVLGNRTIFGMDPTPFSANDKQYTTFNLQTGKGGVLNYVWADRGQKLLGAFSAQSIQKFLAGKISNLFIYNKILSEQEVLQNYNATKSRFNL